MPKLLQIYDEDLATLEQLCPEIADRLIGQMDNALRIKMRRIQTILSNVRWNYGPPTQVESIPASDEGG